MIKKQTHESNGTGLCICMDVWMDVWMYVWMHRTTSLNVKYEIGRGSLVVGTGGAQRQDKTGAVGGIDTAALCVCSNGESGAGCVSRRARRKETPRREEGAEEKPERMCG